MSYVPTYLRPPRALKARRRRNRFLRESVLQGLLPRMSQMPKLSLLLGFAGTTVLGCPQPATNTPRVEVLELSTHSIASRSSVRITAYLPGGVPDAVIVFLHGVGGSDSTWAELGGPQALSTAMDGLQDPPPRVLVVAVAGDSLGWPEYRDSTVSWEQVLAEELPAFLRSRFGEHLSGQRIAYLGTSAGGEKVITMALRRPEAFRCIAAHSPAIHPPDPSRLPGWARGWEGWEPLYGLPINEELWRSENVIHLAATVSTESLTGLDIYFDVGADDHLGFQTTSAKLSNTLASRGVPHEFALRPGGHGSAFTAEHLPKSLAMLLRCLAAATN